MVAVAFLPSVSVQSPTKLHGRGTLGARRLQAISDDPQWGLVVWKNRPGRREPITFLSSHHTREQAVAAVPPGAVSNPVELRVGERGLLWWDRGDPYATTYLIIRFPQKKAPLRGFRPPTDDEVLAFRAEDHQDDSQRRELREKLDGMVSASALLERGR